MPYKCKRCGSLIVRHACRTTMTTPFINISKCVMQSSIPSSANVHTPSFNPGVASAANVNIQPPSYETLKEKTRLRDRCVECGIDDATTTKGLELCKTTNRIIRRKGDLLCEHCRSTLNDKLREYIPKPPERPGGYLIMRSRHKTRISHKDAVTLLWLAGDRVAAYKKSLCKQSPSVL